MIDNQPGKYGYHPKLEDVLEIVEQHETGIKYSDLADDVDFHRHVLEQIVMQAEALGMIHVKGAGQGNVRRLYPADYQHIKTGETTNNGIVSKVREALNRLEDLDDSEGVHITIQKQVK